MKKILVLGAGFLQSFLIIRSVELGFFTIALDKDPNALGFKYANEHDVIDIVDKVECLKYAKSKNIDGVITAATDYGVITAAYIAKELQLPGLNYEVANLIKNKYLVRKKLHINDADHMSQFYLIKKNMDFKSLSKKLKYPLIIKPIDGSGSKGVHKINNLAEFEFFREEAISCSLQNKAYVEDFIEGKEYGVESVVFNNEIHVLCVMNKEMTKPPIYSELGHSVPNDLETDDFVVEVVKKTIKALGINFGAVNMDVLIKDNNVFVIDIGARMGGNLIGSHIVPIYTGFDYMGYLLKIALNLDVSTYNFNPSHKNHSIST